MNEFYDMDYDWWNDIYSNHKRNRCEVIERLRSHKANAIERYSWELKDWLGIARIERNAFGQIQTYQRQLEEFA